MLRLKQAMEDCKIPQQALVAFSGWSKTQVSLTLKTGKLPANADKFRDDVKLFVGTQPTLVDWLNLRHMPADRLFDAVLDVDQTPGSGESGGAIPDLATQIYNLAGKATIDGGLSRGTALRLVRALHFLSFTVTPELAAVAAGMLAGQGKEASPHEQTDL